MNNLDRFKFRFYHFGDKKMYDVITFQKLPKEDFIRCFIIRPLPNGISIDDIKDCLTAEERRDSNLVLNHKTGIDGELMQSTGLKDKNRNLIYDGDILSTQDPTHHKDDPEFIHDVVKWYDGGCFGTCDGDMGLDSHFLKTSEIIGNIYENPELLINL